MERLTIDSISNELAREIAPYTGDIDLYALTVGQVLFLVIQSATRAKETRKKSHHDLASSLLSQLASNHPELAPTIQKYDHLLSQLGENE